MKPSPEWSVNLIKVGSSVDCFAALTVQEGKATGQWVRTSGKERWDRTRLNLAPSAYWLALCPCMVTHGVLPLCSNCTLRHCLTELRVLGIQSPKQLQPIRMPQIPVTQAASTNQNATNCIPCENPEGWLPCLAHKAKQWIERWWILNKAFEASLGTHLSMTRDISWTRWGKLHLLIDAEGEGSPTVLWLALF